MHELQNHELIAGDAVRTESETSRLDLLFGLPEWSIEIQERVFSLTTRLIQIVDAHILSNNNKIQIVVGGKSRILTETLLSSVRERLPRNHDAIRLIDDRVRLNDTENRNLYGETTSTQIELVKAYIIPPALAEHSTIIFIDDYINSGRKAFNFLKAFEDRGNDAYFLSFGGDSSSIMSGDPSRRPADWDRFSGKVFIAEGNNISTRILELTSTLLSRYLDLRLNHRISMAKVTTSARITELSQEHARNLSKAKTYIQMIRTMLISSDQHFIKQREMFSHIRIEFVPPQKQQ